MVHSQLFVLFSARIESSPCVVGHQFRCKHISIMKRANISTYGLVSAVGTFVCRMQENEWNGWHEIKKLRPRMPEQRNIYINDEWYAGTGGWVCPVIKIQSIYIFLHDYSYSDRMNLCQNYSKFGLSIVQVTYGHNKTEWTEQISTIFVQWWETWEWTVLVRPVAQIPAQTRSPPEVMNFRCFAMHEYFSRMQNPFKLRACVINTLVIYNVMLA